MPDPGADYTRRAQRRQQRFSILKSDVALTGALGAQHAGAKRRNGMAWSRKLATAIGSIGVGLLLLAFVLNLAKILKADSVPYLGLNLVGASSPARRPG